MQLSKIRIKNYRLLIDAELEVDPETTLIVGRNMTYIIMFVMFSTPAGSYSSCFLISFLL